MTQAVAFLRREWQSLNKWFLFGLVLLIALGWYGAGPRGAASLVAIVISVKALALAMETCQLIWWHIWRGVRTRMSTGEVLIRAGSFLAFPTLLYLGVWIAVS